MMSNLNKITLFIITTLLIISLYFLFFDIKISAYFFFFALIIIGLYLSVKQDKILFCFVEIILLIFALGFFIIEWRISVIFLSFVIIIAAVFVAIYYYDKLLDFYIKDTPEARKSSRKWQKIFAPIYFVELILLVILFIMYLSVGMFSSIYLIGFGFILIGLIITLLSGTLTYYLAYRDGVSYGQLILQKNLRNKYKILKYLDIFGAITLAIGIIIFGFF